MTRSSPGIRSAEATRREPYGPGFPAIDDVDAARGAVYDAIADFRASHEDIARASVTADYTLMAYLHSQRLESSPEPGAEAEPEAEA